MELFDFWACADYYRYDAREWNRTVADGIQCGFHLVRRGSGGLRLVALQQSGHPGYMDRVPGGLPGQSGFAIRILPVVMAEEEYYTPYSLNTMHFVLR